MTALVFQSWKKNMTTFLLTFCDDRLESRPVSIPKRLKADSFWKALHHAHSYIVVHRNWWLGSFPPACLWGMMMRFFNQSESMKDDDVGSNTASWQENKSEMKIEYKNSAKAKIDSTFFEDLSPLRPRRSKSFLTLSLAQRSHRNFWFLLKFLFLYKLDPLLSPN